MRPHNPLSQLLNNDSSKGPAGEDSFSESFFLADGIAFQPPPLLHRRGQCHCDVQNGSERQLPPVQEPIQEDSYPAAT
jgi:hypothetical protein